MVAEADLTRFADRLRGLADLAPAIAVTAAPLLEEAARATANAGSDPEGKAWKPRKAGGTALPGAAGAISASATSKGVVTIVLRGVYVLHHFGTSRVPARPILPTLGEDLPAPMAAALKKAASVAVARAMGGRS